MDNGRGDDDEYPRKENWLSSEPELVSECCTRSCTAAPKAAKQKIMYKAYRSDKSPTKGIASTEPMDCAALTAPRVTPAGCPKYSRHCARDCKPFINDPIMGQQSNGQKKSPKNKIK